MSQLHLINVLNDTSYMDCMSRIFYSSPVYMIEFRWKIEEHLLSIYFILPFKEYAWFVALGALKESSVAVLGCLGKKILCR